jgi:4-diphosphocytidyl-2-C-methyl-D-erythritol kinase
VVARRADGFHELVSVFQAISLADELGLEPADDVELTTDPALPFASSTNLAMRAALLLRERAGVQAGARLRLRKRVPLAAGLGGGSADAAAALFGLRRLWNLGGLDLTALAEALGSDVPYFLHSATVLVRGRGERLQDLPPLPARGVVLMRPPVALPTGEVFANLRPEEWTDGGATLALAAALATGDPLPAALPPNTLLAAAERCCPPLAALRAALTAAGWRPALSGSGPTLFLFPNSNAEAAAMQRAARRLGAQSWRCRTIRRPPLSYT